MKLYKAMRTMEVDGKTIVDKHSIMESAMALYSKMKQLDKSHRCVLDRQTRDIHEIEKTVPLVNNGTVVLFGMNKDVKNEMIGELVVSMNKM